MSLSPAGATATAAWFDLGGRLGLLLGRRLVAMPGTSMSRLVIRYQTQVLAEQAAAGRRIRNRAVRAGPVADDSSGRRRITRRISVSSPGQARNASSLGLIASMVIRPRPTRLSTASRCGLASPSGIVEAPSFAFKHRKVNRPLRAGADRHRCPVDSHHPSAGCPAARRRPVHSGCRRPTNNAAADTTAKAVEGRPRRATRWPRSLRPADRGQENSPATPKTTARGRRKG